MKQVAKRVIRCGEDVPCPRVIAIACRLLHQHLTPGGKGAPVHKPKAFKELTSGSNRAPLDMICGSVISWPDLLLATFCRKIAIHHAALQSAHAPRMRSIACIIGCANT